MNALPSIKTSSKDEQKEKQNNDIFYINNALKTAECANKYAHELRTEFNELLLQAISRTDVKVAGRFVSLLNELCFMTSMTKRNIFKGSDNDIH